MSYGTHRGQRLKFVRLSTTYRVTALPLLVRFPRRSNQVTDRLYTGGLPDAVRLVQAGLSNPHDFNLMLGVSGWAPQQLASEINCGMWHCVAASPDLILPRKGE